MSSNVSPASTYRQKGVSEKFDPRRQTVTFDVKKSELPNNLVKKHEYLANHFNTDQDTSTQNSVN